MGDFKIDGVPGKGAPILLKFKNLVGGATGKMLPTGKPNITVKGIEVTCLDISMPIVMAKATDFGIRGNETSNELNKNLELLNKIEEIRVIAGAQMGLGDVSGKVIPKFALLSRPLNGGLLRLDILLLIPVMKHTLLQVLIVLPLLVLFLIQLLLKFLKLKLSKKIK